ncbi:MAG: T9SS type A sorting domain-containing protein [Ferruginibacter sp.]
MRTIIKFAACIIMLFLFKTAAVAQMAASKATLIQPSSTETVSALMQRQALAPAKAVRIRPEMEGPNRKNLPQNPLAKPDAFFPPRETNGNSVLTETPSSLIPGTSFNGVTGPTETGAFPPDDMGAIGPTQYIVAVNGRIRSFNKSTGVADGVLDLDTDVFFTSVLTPPTASNFTSDPRVRYDRVSARWLILIIDVPGGAGSLANYCLLAVSNSSTITAGTTWTYSKFLGQTSRFFDYPTLGLDVNAAYIGGNMFTLAGAFSGTNGYVINRANLMAGGAYTVYAFTNLATGSVAGPYTPQGVDNFDLLATEGYFVGVDALSYSLLQIRRVSTPAGVPTISANISLTVNTTSSPLRVPHLGNTGGAGGQLDALDDRLYAAMIRNGRLWTAHNISVNASGVGVGSGGTRRNGTRWYELQNLGTTPTVRQSGTIFDPAATSAAARWYSIPSIMVSGQGHAVISMTTAGVERANAAAATRFSADVLGTMQTPVLVTASTTAYNPPSDPGGGGGRRWGDYSYVSLDPLDDMTMWAVNQYCVGTNLYGCNVTKLLAPPPATPASTFPAFTGAGQSAVDIIVTGTSISGSGFYDPGADMAPPALPFNHITATVSGGITVNSVTYNSPTQVTININTVGAPQGSKNITITNPDGQSLTGVGIFDIFGVVPVAFTGLKGKLNNNLTVSLNWSTSTEVNNKGFYVERTETSGASGWENIGFVAGAINSAVTKNYTTIDNNIQLDKIYRYRLKQVDFDGNFNYSNEVVIRVKDLHKNILILTSSPNPFRLKTSIKYNLPSDGLVSLKVYDLSGKEIAVLATGFQKAGLYNKEFNAAKLSSGTYFCKLVFGKETLTSQVMLIE